jgi:hypothetical protein
MQDDFRVFARELWTYLGLPPPTRAQYDIARRLQKGPRRHIIQAFRGVGKSYLTAAYVLWRLYCDPQCKVLVVSASKQRADEFSKFARAIIEDWEALQHLKPRQGQRDSVVSFDVGPATADQSPSVKSVGITGQMTGSRADLIVADDVEIPTNSLTQLKRDRLSEAVKEFDAVLKPGGQVLFLGTPQCEESLYDRLQAKGFLEDGSKLYDCMIWPARYPSEDVRQHHGHRLAPLFAKDLDELGYKPGAPTDPARFDDQDLIEREMSYGKAGFALQFMLDTSLSDADRHPLKLMDLIIHDVDLDVAPHKLVWSSSPDDTINDLPVVGLSGDRYQRAQIVDKEASAYHTTIMAIDPSGRGKDRTGYAIVKNLNGFLYVPAVGGLVGGYEDKVLIKLAKLAADNNVNAVLVEPNFGGGMFGELFKPVLNKYARARIEETSYSRIQKEMRICDTLEPIMARHRLVIDPRCIREDYDKNQAPEDIFHMFAYQLTRMTRERGAVRHDDAVDALAMAVAWFTDRMAVDADLEAQRRKDEAFDKELQDFVDGVSSFALLPGATKPPSPNMLGDV